MIDDLQIIEAAQRAERIKAAMPQLAISADAIFGALILGKRGPGRPRLNTLPSRDEPPDWFTLALATLKGQTLTCTEFLFRCGHFPCTKTEKNDVARWLRASGRVPVRRGKQRIQKFVI